MLALLLLSSPALAAWPEDVDLYSMLDHGGERVYDRELLGRSYRQLVMELGTMVANKPIHPANTTGISGFELDLGTQFVLTEAHDRKGEPSPWMRAHRDEQSAPYHVLPTLTVRKGLPLSTEVGASLGWIGGSSTGTFGGFARVAVLEGYRPLPEVALQLGYSGYVGNDQLDCGALDLGVTLGTTAPLGRLPGINSGQISPWANFTTLRVRANASVEEDVEDEIGALRYAGPGRVQVPQTPTTATTTTGTGQQEERAPPIAIPQFAAGFQIVSGNAHFRLAASWAPATIPTVSTGLGLTF